MNPIVTLTQKLIPPFEEIERDVNDFRKAHPAMTAHELADAYGNRICWKYTSVGVATALPSAIPGIGTMTQIAVEGGSISTDLALMLRWMGSMTCGIGYIHGRDMTTNFNQDFVKVLGLWCGVLKTAEQATKRVATKVVVAQFKKVPGKIFQKINQKVGTTIVTKYGAKRGGIAIGRLIPFGVGSIVGGTYNGVTMRTFKKKATVFFATDNDNILFMG